MTQAHRWLPIFAAAALVGPLSIGPAHAQSKKPGGKKPTTPTAPSTAPASGAATAPPGGSTEIELDTDTPTKPPEDAATPPPTSGDTGAASGGGICEIDPSACPKELDVKATAKKDVKADVYAVQQIYALRNHRFEIQPYWSFTLNDQFVSHPGPGLALNYYITNVLAIGVNGNYYGGLNVDSDFNFENRRATRVAVPLNEYQWGANLNFTYVPMYGKFAGFGDFIFHYDAYVVGGVGAISTRPIAVIDPDNRKFDYKPKLDFNVGIGLRIFLNRWFAVNLEVRDYIYIEQLEALNVAPATSSNSTSTAGGPRDSSLWLGQNSLTNNVQAQLGISIFLPFSWDYRLPK